MTPEKIINENEVTKMRISTLLRRSLNSIDLMQLLIVFVSYAVIFLSQTVFSFYAWVVFILYWLYLVFFVVSPSSIELG